FSTYTLRARAMNSSSKACAFSLMRMSSSITHRRSLTALSRARSSTTSPAAAGCAIQVFSSADSSARTLASLAGSVMRSDLICRIAILSSSSPYETGTRSSFGCDAGSMRGSLHAPDEDHGDVVRAAAVERGGDQLVNAFLGAAVQPRQDRRDPRVVHFLGKAVAAQQQLHAHAELAGHGLHVQLARVGDAERLGHDVAVRVAARLLDADRALADQLLHVTVVLGQLRKLAVAPQVDPAV